MKPPWSPSHSACSLVWLPAILAWIKVTHLRWGCLSFFSALARTMPYTINEKFSEGMITSLEVWNLVVSQLWEDGRQWDNRVPYGQFGQSHRLLWNFILCLRGRHNQLPYQWDPIWALSPMRMEPWLENWGRGTGDGGVKRVLYPPHRLFFLKPYIFFFSVLESSQHRKNSFCCPWLLLCSEMHTFPTHFHITAQVSSWNEPSPEPG